jgi:hypothetical protein
MVADTSVPATAGAFTAAPRMLQLSPVEIKEWHYLGQRALAGLSHRDSAGSDVLGCPNRLRRLPKLLSIKAIEMRRERGRFGGEPWRLKVRWPRWPKDNRPGLDTARAGCRRRDAIRADPPVPRPHGLPTTPSRGRLDGACRKPAGNFVYV